MALGVSLAACTAAGSTGGAPASPAPAPAPASAPARSTPSWPIKIRYPIDLWLHGYAMIEDDTTLVPYFRRGYRDQMVVLKNRANVISQLDANRDRLRAYLASHPGLIGGQFLALSFGSWEEMQRAIELFLQANGDPQRARDPALRAMIATIAASYPTAADRDWLRTFTLSVADEGTKFYRSYWGEQQRERSRVLAALDSGWTRTYLPKLQGFLNNTQQGRGELFVALPLGGEGRTISGGGGENAIAVTYPDSEPRVIEAVYVFVHEAVGVLANQVVADNTTPAEQRAGVAARYGSAAAVRGGSLLLARVAPELRAGYERYYLQVAGVNVADGPDAGVFERTFPLPQSIVDALRRQIDIVLGGI
jgi:hypothetical protein